MTTIHWDKNSSHKHLTPNEAHIYFADFSKTRLDIDKEKTILTTDELKRAQRFYFKKDHDRFIICHVILRKILSHYLDCLPQELTFKFAEKGKPYLELNLKKNKLNIKFNLSHSGQFAIFAFNLDSDIGVDIEAIVENPKQRELVHRFFSKKEQEDLNSLPENQKTLAFFKCWTQKEAFLKATGKGFSLSLKDFDVDVFPNHEASFTNIRHKDFSIQNWHLHTLKPSIECIGSLCLKGEPKKLRCWRWD